MKAGQSLPDHDLILVTGGAGFIGSNIVLELAQSGARVAVCDLLRSGEKGGNPQPARLHDVFRPEALFEWLARHSDRVTTVVHMGAISSTTETDVDKFVATNIRLSLDLWRWCADHSVRFIYASSAATYGDGNAGFNDQQHPDALAALRPLNPYGWRKHVVDQRVISDMVRGEANPPTMCRDQIFQHLWPKRGSKGRHAVASHEGLSNGQDRRARDSVQITQSRLPRWRPAARFRLCQRLRRRRPVAAAQPPDKRIVQCRNRHRALVPRPRQRRLRGGQVRAEYPFCRHPHRAACAISVFHSRRRHQTAPCGLRCPVLFARGRGAGLPGADPRKLKRRSKWRR